MNDFLIEHNGFKYNFTYSFGSIRPTAEETCKLVLNDIKNGENQTGLNRVIDWNAYNESLIAFRESFKTILEAYDTFLNSTKADQKSESVLKNTFYYVPIYKWGDNKNSIHGTETATHMYSNLQDLYGFEYDHESKVQHAVGHYEISGNLPTQEEFEKNNNV